MANKKRICCAPSDAPRTCIVSFHDSQGIRRVIEVQAESLYEAAAMAIAAFRSSGFVEQMAGPASRFEIQVQDQRRALRSLNGHLHRIEVLTFDQLLRIADRVLSVFEDKLTKAGK